MIKKRDNEEIEAFTRRILKEYKRYTAPVDPYALATDMGVDVYEVEFDDDVVSGMIQTEQGTTELFVNAYDSSRRKRFTVAHELGHILLHFSDIDGEYVDSANDVHYNSKVMYRNNPDLTNDERYREYEANQFAAALLMDSELIAYSWERLKSVALMADLFRVSSSTMEIRLNTLGLLQ